MGEYFDDHYCPECFRYMSPLVLSPADPKIVGFRCDCGFEELTELGKAHKVRLEAADYG